MTAFNRIARPTVGDSAEQGSVQTDPAEFSLNRLEIQALAITSPSMRGNETAGRLDFSPSAQDNQRLLDGKLIPDVGFTNLRYDASDPENASDMLVLARMGDNGGRNQGPSREQQRIGNVAARLSGQELWSQSRHADLTIDGKFGCAAAASVALQKAGFRWADAATVGTLYNQLVAHGWKKVPVDQAQDGDVVIGTNAKNWKNGGGKSHVGIMDGGLLYNNSKRNDAKWTGESIDTALAVYPTRFVMRPPATR